MTIPNHQHDASLAIRLRARDPLALEALYDSCGGLVYRLALGLLHDAAAAEDLTQETFLYVWTRIAAYDAARGSLARWVYLVARSRILDHLRSPSYRARQRCESLDALPSTRAADLDRAAPVEHRQLLAMSWQCLNPNQQETLRLAHWHGFSQPEIAERLNRPLGTVKTWMRQGQQRLRAALLCARPDRQETLLR
jgi:RNA polymerase sigma-70 factor (ECF subfamily)